MAEVDTKGEEQVESHTEGILLFSESQTCYGKPLSSILEEISTEIWGYGESIMAEPHADGWETIQLASEDPDANKHVLDNSVWLIHYDCLYNNNYKSEFNLHISSFPREGCVIVWADPEVDDVDEDVAGDTSRYPDKVSAVTSEEELKRALTWYLGHGVNPKTGAGQKIKRWKQRVEERKRDIG